MNLQTLYNKLQTTGMPVAYMNFPSDSHVKMPFITYNEAFTNNQRGDDTVYKKIRHMNVDLWTGEKDTDAEDTLEAVLSGIGFWEVTEIYEEEQAVYRRTYDFEITA